MQAFKLTRELNARPDAPKVSAASNAEVERVLAAKTDLDVMQVKPGSSTAVIKKRYRAMTLALHPDKCKVHIASQSEPVLLQGSLSDLVRAQESITLLQCGLRDASVLSLVF